MMRQKIQKSPAEDALDEFWQLGGGVGEEKRIEWNAAGQPGAIFQKETFFGVLLNK